MVTGEYDMDRANPRCQHAKDIVRELKTESSRDGSWRACLDRVKKALAMGRQRRSIGPVRRRTSSYLRSRCGASIRMDKALHCRTPQGRESFTRSHRVNVPLQWCQFNTREDGSTLPHSYLIHYTILHVPACKAARYWTRGRPRLPVAFGCPDFRPWMLVLDYYSSD
jgi:hypothetical protein